MRVEVTVPAAVCEEQTQNQPSYRLGSPGSLNSRIAKYGNHCAAHLHKLPLGDAHSLNARPSMKDGTVGVGVNSTPEREIVIYTGTFLK